MPVDSPNKTTVLRPEPSPKAVTPAGSSQEPQLVFMANSMYSGILSGGDIHTLNMAAGALLAGYAVHFFTGHALKSELESRNLPVAVTLTDREMMKPRDFDNLGGQLAMLAHYLGKTRSAFKHLREIRPDSVVYANTDFWWDSLPVIFSKAACKLMILGMDCPTLGEIVCKSRPDVKGIRLPSLHYWLSQQIALRWFRFCRKKRLLYIHPNQKQRLLRFGYTEHELVYVSNGFDLNQVEKVPDQPKTYDAAWAGRVHQQKGIEDLLHTLAFLGKQFRDFRAVLIGNVKKQLAPRIEALGMSDRIHFSGFVSEAEKFRLLKSSRVFLMPSRYESWGIVIAEALASGVPVVAYELDAYRPVFGDLVRYAPPFNLEAFQRAAAEEIIQSRSSKPRLDPQSLACFREENSWDAAGRRFVNAVKSMVEEQACRTASAPLSSGDE